MPTPYRIHQIKEQRKSAAGITKPAACTLHGILKFDCSESPHLVYNEYVALRLAQALQIPVADGVLTIAGNGYAYASLEVALPGIDLPDMRRSDARKVSERYPDQVASILAFDYWIGNRDRSSNIKAALFSSHIPLFRGYDHQFALLDVEGDDPWGSIETLGCCDQIVAFHPFLKTVDWNRVQEWVHRIAALSPEIIGKCCVFGQPFRTVTDDLQEELRDALVIRAQGLDGIIKGIKGVI